MKSGTIKYQMEGANQDGFQLGRSSTTEADKKKKNLNRAEEHIKSTFNFATAGEQDDLKRKREEYAVQLRKKKK